MAKCNYYNDKDKSCDRTENKIKYGTNEYYVCCNDGDDCVHHPQNSRATFWEKKKMYQNASAMKKQIRLRNDKASGFLILIIGVAAVLYMAHNVFYLF